MTTKPVTIKPVSITLAAATAYAQHGLPPNSADRQALEAALQRLDVAIAEHATRAVSHLEPGCTVTPYAVFTWRHGADVDEYERWRDDLFASRYWDAADAGAAESGPEGRTFPLLDTLTIYLVGIISTLLVQGICRMFAGWGGH